MLEACHAPTGRPIDAGTAQRYYGKQLGYEKLDSYTCLKCEAPVLLCSRQTDDQLRTQTSYFSARHRGSGKHLPECPYFLERETAEGNGGKVTPQFIILETDEPKVRVNHASGGKLKIKDEAVEAQVHAHANVRNPHCWVYYELWKSNEEIAEMERDPRIRVHFQNRYMPADEFICPAIPERVRRQRSGIAYGIAGVKHLRGEEPRITVSFIGNGSKAIRCIAKLKDLNLQNDPRLQAAIEERRGGNLEVAVFYESINDKPDVLWLNRVRYISLKAKAEVAA